MARLKVEIELPGDLVSALGIRESELSRRAQEWIVLELFQEGEISSGRGAEILGLTKSGFLDLLNRRNLPYLDAESGELAPEVEAALAAARSSSTR